MALTRTMMLRREFSFYCSLLPEEFDLEVYPDCWLDATMIIYKDGSVRFETKTDDAGRVVHESFHFMTENNTLLDFHYWEKDTFYDDGVREVRIGNNDLSSYSQGTAVKTITLN